MIKNALLVIDVQTGLAVGAYNESSVVDAINKTASWIRGEGGLVIFIQHCHSSYEPMIKGHSGWELHPDLDVQDADSYVEKEASDSFYESNLGQLLKDNNIDHLYITGLQTEFCVDTTCRSALSHGYSVTLLSDAHTTGDSHLPAAKIIEHHNNILANLAHPKYAIDVRSSGEL